MKAVPVSDLMYVEKSTRRAALLSASAVSYFTQTRVGDLLLDKKLKESAGD